MRANQAFLGSAMNHRSAPVRSGILDRTWTHAVAGLRSPYTGQAINGRPLMTAKSAGLTPAARAWPNTSWSPISGLSMSLSCMTSAEPYMSWTIAFVHIAPCRAPVQPASPVGVWRVHGAERTRSGPTVSTVLAPIPIRNRYTSIQTSAIVDGMVMKAWIVLPKSGTRNAARMSTR